MREYDPKAIGARIRKCRRALDLSQTQVASAAGISQRYMSSIEGGKVEGVSVHLMDTFATILDTRVEVLMYGEAGTTLEANV